ncbi:MAG: hypothetical protein QXG03_04065, partial [Halalkalicoccus sp.]
TTNVAFPTATRSPAVPAAIALLCALGAFVPPFSNPEWPLYARAVPLALGAVVALTLLTSGSRVHGRIDRPRLPVWSAKAVASLVFAGSGLLLVLAAATGGRGLLFYLLAGALGSVLLAQLWLAEEPSPRWTLAGVLVLAGAVRFGALATTPGYVGLDVWSHLPSFAAGIAAEESLDAIAGDKYAVSPLYHLAVVSTALLADVSLRTALFLSVGLGMLVAPLFVYLLARPLLAPRWALLAATTYALADHAILWGIYLVPTSLGLLFFLGVVYALLAVVRRGYTLGNTALFFAFLLSVVFTHQVSSFVTATFLGAAVLAQFALRIPRLYPERPTNLVWLFLGCLALLTAIWTATPYSGAGGSFVDTVLVFLVDAHQTTSGIAIEYGVPEADYGMRPLDSPVQLIEGAGALLLAVAAGVGAVHVAGRRRADQSRLTLVFAAGAMGFFLLVPALFGIRTFLPGRWFVFLFVPLAVLGAVGLARLDDRAPRLAAVCVLAFALAVPLTMAVSAPATVDDPAFDDRPQFAFSDAELTAMETIASHTDEPLYTDYLYAEAFDRTETNPAASATLADGGLEGDPYVYREYQSTGSPLFGEDHNHLAIQRIDRESACAGEHRSYDNGHVALCG